MKIKILYFANLASELNCEDESLSLDASVSTVSSLIDMLSTRGENWQRLLNQSSTRCAVNQSLANHSTVLNDGDELAFFPPVTGG